MRKFRIVVEGRPYEVEVEEISGDNTPAVIAPVAPVAIIAAAPAPAPVVAAVIAKPVTSGGTPLKSPMPGTVLGLKVANGSKVKRGENVLVLEAMKMENDIAADADGIITFKVTKGSTVNTGDVLATIA